MRALVTGVSSGIGAGIAKFLSDKGWQVSGIDFTPPAESSIHYHALDLSQLENVAQFVSNHDCDYDAFIHCAGIREICNPCDLSMMEWCNIMNVNLNSAFVLAQSVIKRSIQNKKPLSVINLASISGIQAEPDRAAYVSSKFALIGLTKQLAFQFGHLGIRTNAIAPGVIETPLTQDYFTDDVLVEKIKRGTPVGYWGHVEHILPLVDLCLTNTYMNGAVLVCDGGWTAGKDL